MYMDEYELDERLGKIEDRLDDLEDALVPRSGIIKVNKTIKKNKTSSSKKKGTKKKGTKKTNEFFETMLQAKREKAKSFQYNGKTYVGKKHKNLGLVYRRK